MNKKINVLMIGPLELNGGMKTVMESYLQSNKYKKKVNLYILNTSKNGNVLLKAMIFLQSILLLNFKILSKKIDIIHIHLAFFASITRKLLLAQISKKIFRKKIILHVHSSELELYLANNKEKNIKKIKKIFSLADKIIVLNKDMDKQLSPLLNEGNKEILYNFSTLETIPKNKESSFENKKIVVLSRITKEKGVFDLLEIMANDKMKEFHLILAGDGEEKEEFISKMNKRKIKNIELVGWIDQLEKSKLLSEAFVTVLPSYYEGISMSILESIKTSTPTIAVNTGGNPEIIENFKNGFLYEIGEIDKVVENLVYLENDFSEYMNICNNSKIKYEKIFSEKIIVEKLLNIYKEMLV